MKDIVIVANFCRDFSESDNGRFMYLCKELSKDHNVEIITSDFSHSAKKHKEIHTFEWPFKITFLHEPGYRKNISVKRFLSHKAWGKNVDRYLKSRHKPDVIYCAVPSLTAALKSAKYCERNNVRFIIDIQDLWPEAFKMAVDIPVVSDIAFMPFSLIADWIYKRADEIIAVSDTYVKRALKVNSKCDSGHTVFLGTRLEIYDQGATKEPFVKKTNNEIWIGYCGSLSASYDIPNLIRAVKILREKNINNIRLMIMGDGSSKKYFESIAEEMRIPCTFTGRLIYDQMCATLQQCDIVVNPIKHGSAASIINKHGDYAASGLPVVNSQESKEYRELIERYNMGLNCKNENAEDMAAKLETLIFDNNLRIEMGQNARRCAEEKFDRKNSYVEIMDCIIS